MNRYETEEKINLKAWKDPEFKKKLQADPHATLKELGMKNLPASIKVKVVEEQKNEWCIVLHVPPANVQNLSEEELKKISAGAGVGWVCCT